MLKILWKSRFKVKGRLSKEEAFPSLHQDVACKNLTRQTQTVLFIILVAIGRRQPKLVKKLPIRADAAPVLSLAAVESESFRLYARIEEDLVLRGREDGESQTQEPKALLPGLMIAVVGRFCQTC
jgi:hypothetical protein